MATELSTIEPTAMYNHSSSTCSVTTTTGLVYDERMMEHLNMWDKYVSGHRYLLIVKNVNLFCIIQNCFCDQTPSRAATENLQDILQTSEAWTG